MFEVDAFAGEEERVDGEDLVDLVVVLILQLKNVLIM